MEVLAKSKAIRRLGTKIPGNVPYQFRDTPPSYDYRDFHSYGLIIFDNGPVDFRIVKTRATLLKVVSSAQRNGYDVLLHPNPLIVTREFWEQYRKLKNGYGRLQLATSMQLLTDDNMAIIESIWIDIDSPYEYSYKALQELISEMDISGTVISSRRTKSGNLRFAFHITPLRPHVVNRKNGKTNLENVKEFISIVNRFFAEKGLNADASFKRVNHPIWLTKPETDIVNGNCDISFYVLYRKAKAVQRKFKLYEKKKEQKKKNHKEYNKKRKEDIITIPKFMAGKIDTRSALEKAVETLSYSYRRKGGTFIYFLFPVAGWCKYLGLSYDDYYTLVAKHITIDKKREIDIKKAWKYARELEFKNDNSFGELYLNKYIDSALDYLKKNGPTPRKKLLQDVFNGWGWLEQDVMLKLKLKGLIKERDEKNPAGTGRPIKVYELIDNDKDDNDNDSSTSNYVDPSGSSTDNNLSQDSQNNQSPNSQEQSNNNNLENHCLSEFVQIITILNYPFSTLVVVGNKKNIPLKGNRYSSNRGILSKRENIYVGKYLLTIDITQIQYANFVPFSFLSFSLFSSFQFVWLLKRFYQDDVSFVYRYVVFVFNKNLYVKCDFSPDCLFYPGLSLFSLLFAHVKNIEQPGILLKLLILLVYYSIELCGAEGVYKNSPDTLKSTFYNPYWAMVSWLGKYKLVLSYLFVIQRLEILLGIEFID